MSWIEEQREKLLDRPTWSQRLGAALSWVFVLGCCFLAVYGGYSALGARGGALRDAYAAAPAADAGRAAVVVSEGASAR